MKDSSKIIDSILFQYYEGLFDSMKENHGLVGEFFGKSTEPSKIRLLCQTRSIYFLVRFAELYDRPDVLESALAMYQQARKTYFVGEKWFHYPQASNADDLAQELDLYGYASLSYTECFLFQATQNLDVKKYAMESLDSLSQRVLSKDFFPDQCVHDGYVSQNPIMHLFESFITGFTVFQQKQIQEPAIRLLEIVENHFYDSTTNLIREVALTDDDVWFEPGHAFEWVSLMKMSHKSISSTVQFSSQELLDAAQNSCSNQQLVPAKVFIEEENENVFRIWTQLERIRAYQLCGQGQHAQEQFALLVATFFDDQLLPKEYSDQVVKRERVKTTTGYHIINGLIDMALARS